MTTEAEATEYLSNLLNRTLHLHTSDGRMFVGQMKCTDNERNIILAMTHEYRQPSESDIKLAAERHERSGAPGNVKVDMKKRYVVLSLTHKLSETAHNHQSTLHRLAHTHSQQIILHNSARSSFMALRTLTRGRIACTNSVHELDILDTLTDDWDLEDPHLSSSALDLHLQCEFAAKDASAIHDILMGFITNGNYADWLCQELALRQENAVAAVKKVVELVRELQVGYMPEMGIGLNELKKRAEHVLVQLQGLNGIFQQLQTDIQMAMAEQAQKQRDAEVQEEVDAQLEKGV
ncbi:unnamed protein product [Zymoseptoria tritici ST99CH_1E4]|uniref:Sm domain-containing protein n=1 Tax=Zymoseptoria tritici ST99CH_1E4 TaxID=1276532 RepID=A0A2H1GBJ9_ZYMTR|nr:unnamed protein product [Zymoseptoria tritici ST99CH_1E4]